MVQQEIHGPRSAESAALASSDPLSLGEPPTRTELIIKTLERLCWLGFHSPISGKYFCRFWDKFPSII